VLVALVGHDTIMSLQRVHQLMRLQDPDLTIAAAEALAVKRELHPDLWDAAVAGVRGIRRVGSRPLSARTHHQEWREFLEGRGWQRGPRDPVAKTHPDLVDWDDLTPAARDQDRVLVSVVVGMTIDAEAA
jgi:hypothetical protein